MKSPKQSAQMLSTRTKLCLLVLFFSNLSFGYVVENSHPSPDGSLQAVLIRVEKQKWKVIASRIEIRNTQGKRLRWKGFVPQDFEHGEVVADGEWTADGEFFVFTTGFLGGHMPWHHPTYFYSRSRNRFYYLDDFIGPITTYFTLLDQNTVRTTRQNWNDGGKEERVSVKLEKLVPIKRGPMPTGTKSLLPSGILRGGQWRLTPCQLRQWGLHSCPTIYVAL